MLKIGLIGTNFIVDQFMSALRACAGAEAVAVYSRTLTRGQTFAAKYGIPYVTDSLDDLFTQVDAVYIASPNGCHYAHTMAALAHGRHVLCEKSITVSREEYLRAEAEAERRGLVYMEAMRPVHDPFCALLRSHLADVGTLRYARFEYCQYSRRYDAYLRGIVENAFDPSLGNAALLDIGVYCVALCAALFGAPEKVSDAESSFLANGFEGQGRATLIYKDLIVDLLWSKITQSVTPSVILGESGALVYDCPRAEGGITCRLRGQDPVALPFTPSENNMVYEIADFISAVREENVRHPYRAITRTTMGVMDDIREKAGIRLPVSQGFIK